MKKLTCALIALQILAVSSKSITSKEPENVCLTATCHRDAERIREEMDTNVDPCDNFYRFACGGFLNKTVIPDDLDSVNKMNILSDKIHAQLRTILESQSSANELESFKAVKNFYKACMNTENEKNSKDYFLKAIKNAGGWPLLEGDNWNETEFNWIESLFNFIDLGFDNNFFVTAIMNPSKTPNSMQNVISLSVNHYTSNYTNETLDFVADIACSLKAYKNNQTKQEKENEEADKQHARTELSKAIKFKEKLYDSDNSSFNSKIIPPMITVKILIETLPSFPWKRYFEKIFLSSFQLNDSDIIFSTDWKLIQNLLSAFNKTSKKDVANYVMSKMMLGTVDYLGEEIINKTLNYSKTINKNVLFLPKWKRCVTFIQLYFPANIGALYVRNNVRRETKEEIVNLITDIQNQVIRNLQAIDWMDNKTQTNAIEKARLMIKRVGYPDEFFNDTKLEEFNANLEIPYDNYLQAALNWNIYRKKYSYSLMRKPFDDSDWTYFSSISVTTPNAFSIMDKNTMIFPIGILQDTFYSNDRPKYMNYGAIGFYIGHEIFHGYNDQGKEFDQTGVASNWWNVTTKSKFYEKAKCLNNQYNNYTVKETGKNLNGLLTLNENIADNGGAKAAYLAYKNWYANTNKTEPRLPGLCYNPLQMFWINTANIWCSKYSSGYMEKYLFDPHSPAELRIIGTFSNLPDFAQDFNCPAGSNMNPINKCNLW